MRKGKLKSILVVLLAAFVCVALWAAVPRHASLTAFEADQLADAATQNRAD